MKRIIRHAFKNLRRKYFLFQEKTNLLNFPPNSFYFSRLRINRPVGDFQSGRFFRQRRRDESVALVICEFYSLIEARVTIQAVNSEEPLLLQRGSS